MSNFDQTMAARVRAERARAELEDNAVENGILQDGHSLVVPLFLADGVTINPKLTFAQRLMAEKVQKAQKAAMDAAASTSTTGGPTMTTRNYTMADAQRFGLKDASALSRPGFRFNGADPYAKDQAIIAYADRDLEYAEAWKTKALPYNTEIVGAASKGPYDLTGQGREGDSCQTADGGRGRKVDVGGGRLICMPEPDVSDYLRESIVEPTDGTSLSDRELAHEEYIRDLESALRNPAGSVLASDSTIPAPQRPDLTKDAATVARDHQESMSRLYAQLDSELSEKWRGNQ